jgi:hypothetical protein
MPFAFVLGRLDSRFARGLKLQNAQPVGTDHDSREQLTACCCAILCSPVSSLTTYDPPRHGFPIDARQCLTPRMSHVLNRQHDQRDAASRFATRVHNHN